MLFKVFKSSKKTEMETKYAKLSSYSEWTIRRLFLSKIVSSLVFSRGSWGGWASGEAARGLAAAAAQQLLSLCNLAEGPSVAVHGSSRRTGSPCPV